MINRYAVQSESNGWGTLLPGPKTEASATPAPRGFHDGVFNFAQRFGLGGSVKLSAEQKKEVA